MDYGKHISELREKLKLNQTENLNESQLYHREIRNELVLKREQVHQLKRELQEANGKVFDLSRELELTKSHLNESDFNLKLALKKSTSYKDKYKEINDSFINLKLKEELRISELEVLNKNLQKISQENYKLLRENEELNDTLRYSKAFQKELGDRQTKLNAMLAKTKENCENLEKEQFAVMEISKKLQHSDIFKKMSEKLKIENENLRKENITLEKKLIEVTTKFDKLYDLINTKRVTGCHENIIGKIKYLQWASHFKKLEEKSANYETIIENLTSTLNKELETNSKMLKQNEELEKRNEQLEKRLAAPKIKIEEKVIEID